MATLPYSAVLSGGALKFNQAIGKTTSRTLDATPAGRAGVWAAAGISPVLPGRSSVPIRATTPNGYTKTIAGTVKKDGVALVGVLVRCHVRATGALVAEMLTLSGGVYSFSGLAPATQYDLLCDPPDSSYNKLVLTRVETAA